MTTAVACTAICAALNNEALTRPCFSACINEGKEVCSDGFCNDICDILDPSQSYIYGGCLDVCNTACSFKISYDLALTAPEEAPVTQLETLRGRLLRIQREEEETSKTGCKTVGRTNDFCKGGPLVAPDGHEIAVGSTYTFKLQHPSERFNFKCADKDEYARINRANTVTAKYLADGRIFWTGQACPAEEAVQAPALKPCKDVGTTSDYCRQGPLYAPDGTEITVGSKYTFGLRYSSERFHWRCAGSDEFARIDRANTITADYQADGRIVWKGQACNRKPEDQLELSSSLTGTYKGSKSILGYDIDATVTLEDSSHLDLKVTGSASVNCKNEAFTLSDGTISITNAGKSGDCIHDALANDDLTLKSVKYSSSSNTITVSVKYSIFSVDITLDHQ